MLTKNHIASLTHDREADLGKTAHHLVSFLTQEASSSAGGLPNYRSARSAVSAPPRLPEGRYSADSLLSSSVRCSSLTNGARFTITHEHSATAKASSTDRNMSTCRNRQKVNKESTTPLHAIKRPRHASTQPTLSLQGKAVEEFRENEWLSVMRGGGLDVVTECSSCSQAEGCSWMLSVNMTSPTVKVYRRWTAQVVYGNAAYGPTESGKGTERRRSVSGGVFT